MRAIIFAGGTATRFDNIVKGFLSINSDTFIGKLIKQLKSLNVKPIYVLTGYHAEKFLDVPDIVLVNNPQFKTTDSAYALKNALDKIGFEDTLMLDADLIVSDDLLPKLISSYKGESISLVDLRTTDPEAMKLVIVNNRIIKFSKDEGIGSEVCEIVDKEKLKKIYTDLDSIRWWGTGPNTKEFLIVEVNPDSKWIEVDTPQEYEMAKKMFDNS